MLTATTSSDVVFGQDGSISMEAMVQRYNGDSQRLGNLCSRCSTLQRISGGIAPSAPPIESIPRGRHAPRDCWHASLEVSRSASGARLLRRARDVWELVKRRIATSRILTLGPRERRHVGPCRRSVQLPGDGAHAALSNAPVMPATSTEGAAPLGLWYHGRHAIAAGGVGLTAEALVSRRSYSHFPRIYEEA
jgi:hypothetical protein